MSKVDYKVLGEFLDYDDLQLEYDRVINNIEYSYEENKND